MNVNKKLFLNVKCLSLAVSNVHHMMIGHLMTGTN